MKGSRPRSPFLGVFLVVAIALFAVSRDALAQSEAECNASNEKSLALRGQGKLIQAQKELAACASDTCPADVKAACRKRSEEISAALPSIVIEVTDATGHPLRNVEVTVDGRPVDPDETSVAVNPGAHKFVFTLAGKAPLERTIFVAEGEKMRHERVTFSAESSSPPRPPPPPILPPTQPPIITPPSVPHAPVFPDVHFLRAFVESVHGPGYIEASLLGLNYSYYPLITGSSYAWAGYRPEIELGLHTSGRGDGLAIGFRQGFVFDAFGGSQAPRVAGLTQFRIGYDLVVLLAGHEVDFGPYLTAGFVYTFDSVVGPFVNAPSGGIIGGAGVDVKLFLAGGFYALVRPIEATGLCFVEEFLCGLNLDFALGVGVTFGGK